MSVQLYQGDCLAVLPTLAAGSVDALVTDPPYGIGFEYSAGREIAATPAAYWEWFGPLYRAALRCVKPGGLVAVWQAQLNFRHFWEWFGEDIHIYCAAKNFVQLRKTAINYGYDPVVMFYKAGAAPLIPDKTQAKRNIDYFVANTAAVVSKPDERIAHPCPRPLDAVIEIIRNFTQPGGVVLDPFMGSGTTGHAAVVTGRDFVGMELDAGYFTVASQRIAAAEAAPRQAALEGVV